MLFGYSIGSVLALEETGFTRGARLDLVQYRRCFSAWFPIIQHINIYIIYLLHVFLPLQNFVQEVL